MPRFFIFFKTRFLYIGAIIFFIINVHCFTVQSQTLSSLGHLINNNSFVSKLRTITIKANPLPGKPENNASADDKAKYTAAAIALETANWIKAVSYAQDNTSDLEQYLKVINSTTNIITPDLTTKAEPLLQISYIILAIKTDSDIKSYYDQHGITDATVKRQIQIYISDIKTVVKNIGPPTVSVFASGDIAGSISNQSANSSSNPNTIGTGSVGVRYVTNEDIVSAKLFVASSQDTLRNNFGQALLSPAKGKALGSGLIEWYHKFGCSKLANPWLHVYGSVASSEWGIDSGASKEIDVSSSVLGAGVLLTWPVFNGKIGSTDASLNLEAGFAIRYLGGDVRSLLKGGTDSASFIYVFPSTKNTYVGPEFGMSINVGDVTAALQAYYFGAQKNNPINGLTGLQFSFGISINASVISGALAN